MRSRKKEIKMKTERDLFNEWLKYYEKHDVVIDQLQRAFMWQAWQASTSREGYKLVPVEPTERMLDNAYSSISDNLHYADLENIYAAMINSHDNN